MPEIKIDWTTDENGMTHGAAEDGRKFVIREQQGSDWPVVMDIISPSGDIEKVEKYQSVWMAQVFAWNRCYRHLPARNLKREQRRFDAAKAAMQGYLASNVDGSSLSPKGAATWAVDYADALLAALEANS
jgi:hypothetical protein